ncbi:hypothetical protein MPTK2_4g01660 [Marchantia polymorpha subsp. ruderalis]
MYDIDALAIGNVESAVRKLIDSLTQFRSTSASQASQIVEEEVNHFQIALKEILRLLADELQPTESGEAPSTDRLVGKLNKAIDYVQSISKYGSGFPDLRVIKHELASLRQEVDCSFSATFDEEHWASLNSPLVKIFAASAKETKEGKEGRLIEEDEEDEDEDEDEDYYDPITYELMCDPVKGSDGHTYDRWTIIDHDMTQSPFDQRRNKPFFIACDDLNVRSSLFEKYGSSGAVDLFHERRRSYRQQAIELANEENHDESEVLKMLNHVLEWDPEDHECQKLRLYIVGRSHPSRLFPEHSIRPIDPDMIRNSLSGDDDDESLESLSSFRRQTEERGILPEPSPPFPPVRPFAGLGDGGCFYAMCCACVLLCCMMCMGRIDEDRLFFNRRRAREGRFED